MTSAERHAIRERYRSATTKESVDVAALLAEVGRLRSQVDAFLALSDHSEDCQYREQASRAEFDPERCVWCRARMERGP